MFETAAAQDSELFYDPFAEEGEELYDADELHKELATRYLNKEIEHDYTADTFVKDTEAHMMTAHFKEEFAAMQTIMQRMHELCGEDHNLQQQMDGSEVLSSYSERDDAHVGHDHAHGDGHAKKAGKKESKKKVSKKTRLSLYEIMLHAREYRKKLFKTK